MSEKHHYTLLDLCRKTPKLQPIKENQTKVAIECCAKYNKEYSVCLPGKLCCANHFLQYLKLVNQAIQNLLNIIMKTWHVKGYDLLWEENN